MKRPNEGQSDYMLITRRATGNLSAGLVNNFKSIVVVDLKSNIIFISGQLDKQVGCIFLHVFF